MFSSESTSYNLIVLMEDRQMWWHAMRRTNSIAYLVPVSYKKQPRTTIVRGCFSVVANAVPN